MKVNITFQNRSLAKNFATQWGRISLRGHSMSSDQSDGSVIVTIYNATHENVKWIKCAVSQYC